MYAKDISQKTRAALRAKAQNGEFLGSNAPFGYKKDPNDKHKLIIDEESAKIVKRIFELAKQGKAIYRIAKIIQEESLPNPCTYQAAERAYGHNSQLYDKGKIWNPSTVQVIIENMAYLGHMAHSKKMVKSFKCKKTIKLPKEDWIIVENTHEPIIDQETWDIVQNQIKSRKRINKSGQTQIFAGLVKCADCGYALTYAGKNNKCDTHYTCSAYRIRGKEFCSNHYIKYSYLYEAILKDIQKYAKLAIKNEEKILKKLQQLTSSNNKEKLSELKSENKKLDKRFCELDDIIKRLYEDNISGKLSDKRFQILLDTYEKEQSQLAEKLEGVTAKINSLEESKDNTASFIKLIRQYANIKELNRDLLVELIDKITIEQSYKVDNVKYQKINIYYKFIGCLN